MAGSDINDTVGRIRDLLLSQSKAGRLRGLLDEVYGVTEPVRRIPGMLGQFIGDAAPGGLLNPEWGGDNYSPPKMGSQEYIREHEARRVSGVPLDQLDKAIYGIGNIDYNNRPVYYHPNGEDFSSLESITLDIDNGKSILIPTVVGGKLLSVEEAIAHAKKTGQNMGIFRDKDEAKKHAIAVEARQEAYYKTPEGQSILSRSRNK